MDDHVLVCFQEQIAKDVNAAFDDLVRQMMEAHGIEVEIDFCPLNNYLLAGV